MGCKARTRKGEKMKLIAFNVSDGTVEIHEATCADVKRGDRKRGSHQRSAHWRSDQVEFGKIDWPTKYAFMYDYWNNGILDEYEDENGPGSFDVWQEMDWKPCTSELPTRETETAPEPAKRGSNALRKEAREALWSGIENMLNDTIYKSQPELYAMMVAQSERVAYMFGMRDEK